MRRQDRPLALTPAGYQALLTLAERDGAVLDYMTWVKVAIPHWRGVSNCR
ncbi:MAG: hypothetical protein M5U34_09905 [Chloroflexi bacterium]|nr:hypothetical protein [Chloroflexota bacterium]